MALVDLSLLDLIPALRPDWKAPYHLRDWCEAIERSLLGGAREMISIPFQHYKSSTTLVGIVWLLLRRPTLRIILMTHSHEKAIAMGKDLRGLLEAAGVQLKKGFNTIHEYQTEQGGGVVAMSAAQSKLGYPCDVLLVDDPLDEKEYMLQATRDAADSSISLYTARAATHLNSVLIVASRWHPDDPVGRRLRRKAVVWHYVCHPGIVDYGAPEAHAFAHDVLTLDQHIQLRREWAESDPSLRAWHAQIQNDPLPDALGFFTGEHAFLGELPSGAIICFGVDAAFTSGSKSDYFAVVGGALIDDSLAVFEVTRHQRGLSQGIATLTDCLRRFPYARFASYVSGAEKGIYNDLYQRGGVSVEQIPARFDKGYRAQKSALSWREGKVLVRMGQPWTPAFINELHAFDGGRDGIDDQVDALTACHDALMASRPAPGFGHTFTFGSPVM